MTSRITEHASLYITLAILCASNAVAELPERWEDPAAVEQRIWQHLQENAKENFTSIQDVKCDETVCQVRFTGTEINDNQDLFDRLVTQFVWKMNAESIPIRRFTVAKIDISPGVPGTIIRFSSDPPPPAEAWRPTVTGDTGETEAEEQTDVKERNPR